MKKIIIVSGDPNSINSEIIYKSWIKINKSLKKRIYLISNHNLLRLQFKKLNYKRKGITYIKFDCTKNHLSKDNLKKPQYCLLFSLLRNSICFLLICVSACKKTRV